MYLESGSRLCPSVLCCLLTVEEFSLHEDLPDALDVIDANHISLMTLERTFLDFDEHHVQVEFGHLRRLSLSIKNLSLIDCNSGDPFSQ